MSISALPTPPDRSDPATFSSRADAFLGALPTFATEANALATQANSDAAVASAAAIGTLAASGTSTDSLTIGTGSKSITTQTGKAITAGMSMKWAMQSDAAKYMTGTVTSYDAGTGALVMNMTATNGSGTSSAWEGVVTAAASGSTITRRAITGTDTVGVSDIAKLIDITSGTFTLAFTACATLGNGAWGYIRNSGTGDVTLDPDGSEQIDGLTSFVMYPGEVRLWQCDGSAIRTIVLTGFRYRFTATAAINIPPGYTAFGHKIASASGGGGSGPRRASGTTSWGGTGGGGGGIHVGTTTGATAGGVLTITVGAKGTGAAAKTTDDTNGSNGTAGGASSLSGGGFNISVAGGAAGQGGTTSGPSGAYGGGINSVSSTSAAGFFKGQQNAAGTSIAEFGGAGSGSQSTNGVLYAAGTTTWGGGAGGGGGGYNTTTPTAASGVGTSTYGGAGGAGGAVATNGSNGTASTTWGVGGGGGGGSSQNGTNSGAGGDGNDGFVDLWGII